MRSAEYTRIAQQLPPVYQDDAASFQQVDAFLGLADELGEQLVERLADLPLTLGPDASLRWPAGLPLDAGADALHTALISQYDDLAQWVAFEFPGSWGRADAGIARRRQFLSKSARLWRRRGTPRGFLDWFGVYFGTDSEAARPYLLEHFKVPNGDYGSEPFTATLFVPSTAQFSDYRRRAEATEFARWYAPAHVAMRVCFVLPSMFDDLNVFVDAPTLVPEGDVGQYETDVLAHQASLAGLLCSVVSVIDHATGIHVFECGTQERPIDQLGVGRLPHPGD